jgi:high-affinity Fe2+/Pb2+ permease
VEELTLLGNAAAVPVIIAITQFLKKNFSFKYKSDVVSFVVAVAVCLGWKFYYTPIPEIEAVLASGWPAIAKGTISQMVVAFATWLSASKSYDLFHGAKKRDQKHDGEKTVLQEQIKELEKVNGDKEAPIEEDHQVADKLRSILEG